MPRWLVFFVLASALLSNPAQADVPHLIRYQGTAVDSQGVPLEGPYTLTFRLYVAAPGSTALWTETHSALPISKGHFAALLGSVTPLASIDWTQPLWLGVQINADPELAPRQQITSVPTAIVAAKLVTPVSTSNIADDANALMPTGAVIIWLGAACPVGYTRVTALDGKFLVGGAGFSAAAGGSNTHTHGAGSYAGPSHTHSISRGAFGYNGGVAATGYVAIQENSDPAQALGGANNDGTTSISGTGPVTGTSAAVDSRPEFATVLLCQKD